VKPRQDGPTVAEVAAHEREVHLSGRKLERAQPELAETGAERKGRDLANGHRAGYFSSVRLDSAKAMQAHAVRFVAPYRVDVAEVAVPEPGPGEVLVRAEFSGISGGTEMLAYRGELDSKLTLDEALPALSGTFQYPFSYGYSAVGIVGEGDRVFAFHPHQSRFVVSADDVVPLGDYDARAATLFPLVETALQITLDAGARYREVAAVLGLGPVGLLTAILLDRSGAVVLASEPKPWRRVAAQACGVEAVEPEELEDAVRAAAGGRGADFLVEATGNPEVLGDGLRLLAAEGVAIVASWYGAKPVTLPLGGEFHRRRLELRSSQVSTVGSRAPRWDRRRRLATVQALLEELPLSTLASHTFPIDQADEAYAALDRGDDGVIHVALAYS
jgi:threonine dehydrogenase-like Zn-dependent dehydrogenase